MFALWYEKSDSPNNVIRPWPTSVIYTWISHAHSQIDRCVCLCCAIREKKKVFASRGFYSQFQRIINIYDCFSMLPRPPLPPLLSPCHNKRQTLCFYTISALSLLHCAYGLCDGHDLVNGHAIRGMRCWWKDEDIREMDCVMLRRKILGYPREMNVIGGYHARTQARVQALWCRAQHIGRGTRIHNTCDAREHHATDTNTWSMFVCASAYSYVCLRLSHIHATFAHVWWAQFTTWYTFMRT